jgi:(4S)-4-hydroxy-5-phosphonooxypentane-2,3-dione isomerase
VSQVAILARVTVKEGKAGQYVVLLEQAGKEPGTLLYAVHRSANDPDVFWTTEIYANDAAFAAHRATEVHAAAAPAAAPSALRGTLWRGWLRAAPSRSGRSRHR